MRPFTTLRWGWVLFETTCVSCRIQFTQHFIEFVIVHMNQLVGSIPNVILTVHMGQRSSRAVISAAGSKRQAPASYFPMQICCMVLILKSKVE